MPGQQVSELIFNRVRDAIKQALQDEDQLITKWSQEAGNNIGTAAIESASILEGGILGVLGDIPVLGTVAEVALEPLKVLLGRAGGVVEGVTLGWALGSALYPTLRAFILPFEHAVQDATQNEIHDPQTAADLVARGLIQHGHGADEAGGGGFDGDHFDRLVGLATTHPEVAALMELFRREVVDQGFVLTTLKRLGYSDEAAGKLITLERNLLSPADLALASLRGILSDETRDAYARQVGITPDDMQVLIGNTGEPLGLMELLEAYRRGFIDKERLERGIRQSRVRNEWIPTAEALRYSPMSTADAVRAVVENYITSDQGGKIAQQNGLMPEHWPIMVESWGRPLAHEQMASLVHRGKASRQQFDQAMRESDIKNKYIDQSFEVAERLLPERLIVQAIKFNAIDLKTGARMLLQLGYSQESVSILLKLGLHEAQPKAHELTSSQIVTLYEQGTLHKDQALQHLEAIHFSPADASYLIQLADTRTHLKEIAQEQQAIRSEYILSRLTADAAETQLHEIGLSPAQAAHLITVWNRERRRVSKTLSVTEITHAVHEQTLQWEPALRLLLGLGYSEHDAEILLLSNGGVPPQQRRPTGGAGLAP